MLVNASFPRIGSIADQTVRTEGRFAQFAADPALLAALGSAVKLTGLSNDGAERWRVRVLGGEVVALVHLRDRRRVVVTVVTLGMAGLSPEPAADDLLASLLATLPEGCR